MHGVFFPIILGCVAFILTECSVLEEFSTDRIRFTGTKSGQQFKFESEKKISLKHLSVMAGIGHGSSFRYANGRIVKSAKGVKRVRLVQTYAGYDVLGSTVAAEMDLSEDLTGHMYGHVVKNINSHIPNPEACQNIAKNLHTKALQLEQIVPDDANVQMKDGRRLIYAGPASERPLLAYRIDFFYKNASDIKYPVYIFDACNGEVLESYDQLMTFTDRNPVSKGFPHLKSSTPQSPSESHKRRSSVSNCNPSCEGEGGNAKTGKVTYNTSPYCLDVQIVGTNCIYEGSHSKLVDNESSTDKTKTTVVTATCSEGYSDAVNGAFGVGCDALFHAELFADFFNTKYGVTTLNYKPRVVVHFGEALEDALCDGTDTYYGDGQAVFYPLVSLDIVAHEIGHAITAKNSRLYYQNQSGGINEAFSDITAITVETWFNNDVPDWKIGNTVLKNRDALRYLDDPTKDGKSIKNVYAYRPLMSVHASSGIFNFAFYHMVDTLRIDIYDAYKNFYDANTSLWSQFSNFFGGACNVMQAAYDNGFSHRRVRWAFWRSRIFLFFCNYAALSSSMYIGETREEILVRAGRSPIIKVELDNLQSNFTVKAMAEDNSRVELFIGTDDEAINVIAKGQNIVKLNNARSPLYVKLMSDAARDVSVKMSLSS